MSTPSGMRSPSRTWPTSRRAATDFDNGINNVDIDGEMTNLATNDLSYRLATRLLSGRYNTLRGAFRGRMA